MELWEVNRNSYNSGVEKKGGVEPSGIKSYQEVLQGVIPNLKMQYVIGVRTTSNAKTKLLIIPSETQTTEI